MAHIHDRLLLDALERQGGVGIQLDAWRVAWKSRDVLDVGASGRWNPPGRMVALYTSLSADGAIAEVYYHLSQAPVFSSAEKLIHKLRIQTHSTLKLDDPRTLEKLESIVNESSENELPAGQAIAAAAHLLEYDSLLVPSVRWPCNNLVVFMDLLTPESIVKAAEPEEINWPAWIEQNEGEFSRIRRANKPT